jgi:leader peptidase (prepilin peptidase)/N-methyltransferase
MGHACCARALRRCFACGTFNAVIPFFFFLVGICMGSFLNVCISRIPEGLSIVSPGSRCPHCLKPIKPYDNVPILGWLWLRGKCRNCHLPISPMYPIIEFLTGVLFVLTYYTFGLTLTTFKFLIFGCLLIILIVTDLRVRILPDAINWPGFGVGLAFAARVPPNDPTGMALLVRFLRHFDLSYFQTHPAARVYLNTLFNVMDALVGAAFGSLLLLGAAALYKLVRKREGMGMGDVKMMAMVGAFLGVRDTFLTIFLGTLLGSLAGIVLVATLYAFGWKKKLAERAHRRGLGDFSAIRWTLASQYHLPLGTFLGIAAFLVVYAMPWILQHMLQ